MTRSRVDSCPLEGAAVTSDLFVWVDDSFLHRNNCPKRLLSPSSTNEQNVQTIAAMMTSDLS